MLYINKIVFMNINELIAIIKIKLEAEISIQNLKIEDKSFLHKKHAGHQKGKFHLKLTIESNELAKFNKIVSTKRVYSVLDTELKEYIHSIQILLN
jgi:BolA protein